MDNQLGPGVIGESEIIRYGTLHEYQSPDTTKGRLRELSEQLLW